MATVATSSNIDFHYSGDGGTTWTAIPGVVSFSDGETSTEEVDVTDYDSPAGWREFANGLKEGGTGSIVLHFDPSNAVHQALEAAAGGAAIQFRVTISSTRKLEFSALVQGFNTPVPEPGGKLVATVNFKTTGASAWAAVS